MAWCCSKPCLILIVFLHLYFLYVHHTLSHAESRAARGIQSEHVTTFDGSKTTFFVLFCSQSYSLPKMLHLFWLHLHTEPANTVNDNARITFWSCNFASSASCKHGMDSFSEVFVISHLSVMKIICHLPPICSVLEFPTISSAFDYLRELKVMNTLGNITIHILSPTKFSHSSTL